MKKNTLINQRRKLLAYLTSATIGVSILTGCGNEVKYQKNQDGQVEIANDLDSNIVNNLILIRLSNKTVEKDDYVLVTQVVNVSRELSTTSYTNIENGIIVYDTRKSIYNNFSVEIIVDNMLDYLYKYDMIKNQYTNNDIEILKNNLINDPDLNIKKDTGKKLVK